MLLRTISLYFFIIQFRLTRTTYLLCQETSPWDIIHNIGINIITGHSFNGFRIPNFWGGLPYRYLFYAEDNIYKVL